MTVRGIFILVMLFSSLMVSAQPAPEQQIVAVLDAQVRAWNRGDIASFMNGYLNSDSTRFVSAKGVTEGYQKVLERYRVAYPTKEKMGELSFSDLKLNSLSSEIAVVIGRWNLKRPEADGGNISGYFTLIFQKTQNGWKIIHDHTS